MKGCYMPNFNVAKKPTDLKDLEPPKQGKPSPGLGGLWVPLTMSPLPTGGPAPRAAAQAEDGDSAGAFLHAAPGIREILAGTRELQNPSSPPSAFLPHCHLSA